MSDVTYGEEARSTIEWAIDTVENHKMSAYTNPVRCLEMAQWLAKLAVELEIALVVAWSDVVDGAE